MYTPLDDLDEFYVQALMLSKVFTRILEKRADIELSSKPSLIVKPVTEFMKRIRASGFSKFQDKTYISTVNFYATEQDLRDKNTLGALIIYIPERYVSTLIQALNYPVIDEDDTETMVDACGTFCNLVAGNYKAGLTQLGYIDLMMSHFSGYQNSVLAGVEFSDDQLQMYEIQFEIKGHVCIIAELSMGHVPKKVVKKSWKFPFTGN